MVALNSFPIVTTDRKATEIQFGLSPALCGDVSLTSPSTSAVVSEAGIRQYTDLRLMSTVSGVNLSPLGVSVFDHVGINDSINQAVVYISPLSSTNERFNIYLSGNTIVADYDGGAAIYPVNANNMYVQGGRYQITDTFGTFPAPDVNGLVSGHITLLNGSTAGIPLCANMQNYLAGDVTLSGLALYTYNKDIALGKVGIRIPYNGAFPIANIPVYLGTDAEPKKLGYFLTKTANDVQSNGEWVNFNYSSEMMNNQYAYFQTPQQIVGWTDGLTNNPGGVGIGILPCVPVMSEARIANDQKGDNTWGVQDADNGYVSGYVVTNLDTTVGNKKPNVGKWKKYGVDNKPVYTDDLKMNPKLNTRVADFGWYHLFDRRKDRKYSSWKTVDDKTKTYTSIKLNLNFANVKKIKQFIMVADSSENLNANDLRRVTNMPISWTVKGSNVDSPDPATDSDWTIIETFTNSIQGNNSAKDIKNGFLESQEHHFTLDNDIFYKWYQFEFTSWNGMYSSKNGMELGKLELYNEDASQPMYISSVNLLPNFKLMEQCGVVTQYEEKIASDPSTSLSINIDLNSRKIGMISDRIMVAYDPYELLTPKKHSGDIPEITVEFQNPTRVNKYCIYQNTWRDGYDPLEWTLYGYDANDVETQLQTVAIPYNVKDIWAFAKDVFPVIDGVANSDDYHYQTYVVNDRMQGDMISSSEQRKFRVRRTFMLNNNIIAYKKYKIRITKTADSNSGGKFSPYTLGFGELEMFEGSDLGGGGGDLSNTRFEARLFYDRMQYGDTDANISSVVLDPTNTQYNQVFENIVADGEVNIYWKDGGWTTPGGTSTVYNVSANSSLLSNAYVEHIGERGDTVSFPVTSGDLLVFYNRCLDPSMINPDGNLSLEYFVKEF